jgi:hypothetical protein
LVNSKVKFRTEARYFDSENDLFIRDNQLVSNNLFVTTSLSIEF